MLIDIVVHDGLDELDALGPLEVLRNAGKVGADLMTRLVTRRPQAMVLGSNGLRLLPEAIAAAMAHAGSDMVLAVAQSPAASTPPRRCEAFPTRSSPTR